MIVTKFGGSSLADAAGFRRVKAILEADPAREVAVVSAPGRRVSGEPKVTDLLYTLEAHLRFGVDYRPLWGEIAERYLAIARECGLEKETEALLAETGAGLKPGVSPDEIASRGEYLCAKLMALYTGRTFADAADWLFFGDDGTVDTEKSYAALRGIQNRSGLLVLPGFYGVWPDGRIRTFSRGGSDITGAHAAAALSAGLYENWTDVPGVLMADPRIVKDPRPIGRLTFGELRELSALGAEVLHEETVFPLRRADIPLQIRNTFDPQAPGTLIRERFGAEEGADPERFITGITGRRDCEVLTVHRTGLAGDPELLCRLLRLFSSRGLGAEHLQTGADSLALAVPAARLEPVLHALGAEVRGLCGPESFSVTGRLGLIVVVGRRMARGRGVSGRLFTALGKSGVNIRMISQSTEEISIVLGVEEEDYERTVRLLYESFT